MIEHIRRIRRTWIAWDLPAFMAYIVLFGGLYFCVVLGLLSDRWLIGFVSGCLWGLVVGACMRWSSSRHWPIWSALTSGQRATVLLAVREGEAIGDRVLAPATIEYAASVTRRSFSPRAAFWLGFAVTAVFLIDAVARLIDGEIDKAAVFGLIALLVAVRVPGMATRHAELLEHARLAEAHARSLLGNIDPEWTRAPEPRTNGFAIASLVLAIVWLLGIASILAVIFGHIALHQNTAPASSEHTKIWARNQKMAVVGLVLGYTGVVLLIVAIIRPG